jgi:hypothetical protein
VLKRVTVLVCAAAVAAVPAVADARTRAPQPTKRVLSWHYTGAHGVTAPLLHAAFEQPCQVNAEACYELETFKHETKVKVDAPAGVAVDWYLNEEYDGDDHTLCGSGSIPVRTGDLVSLVVVLDPRCPGVPTQGTIRLTVTGKR